VSARVSRIGRGVVALALVGVAARAIAFEETSAGDAERVAKLEAEIAALAQQYAACSPARACRVMPVGFDACGNPRYHVTFGDAPGAWREIYRRALTVTYTEEDTFDAAPRPTDCRAVALPDTTCSDGRCVLVR
jgi:hypothetical protein